eukprot:31546-Pelagococcus_subviridis.AAC.3
MNAWFVVGITSSCASCTAYAVSAFVAGSARRSMLPHAADSFPRGESREVMGELARQLRAVSFHAEAAVVVQLPAGVPRERAQRREVRVRRRGREDVDANLLPRALRGHLFVKRIRGRAIRRLLVRPRVSMIVPAVQQPTAP